MSQQRTGFAKPMLRAFVVAAGATFTLAVGAAIVSAASTHGGQVPAGLRLIAEFKAPGIEAEIAGIQPDPKDNNVYFMAANSHPVYKDGQKPLLPRQYRGKLLAVDGRTGQVVRATPLADGQYGGMASGQGFLFVASLNPPEILKVNPGTGALVSRFAVSSPIGGLEYDAERGKLIAQMFVGFPRLEVIDPNNGATVESLWSDESAMDLKKVENDWLCTWVSSFDADAFGELRLIDQQTGKVKGRMRLPGVFTSLGRLDKDVAGVDGFLSMVTLSRDSGRVVIQKYAYDRSTAKWEQ